MVANRAQRRATQRRPGSSQATGPQSTYGEIAKKNNSWTPSEEAKAEIAARPAQLMCFIIQSYDWQDDDGNIKNSTTSYIHAESADEARNIAAFDLPWYTYHRIHTRADMDHAHRHGDEGHGE